VCSLAWSPDGKTLAVGTQNWRVGLWDTFTGEVIGSLAHERVRSLAWSRDGKTLASCDRQGFKLWDTTTLREKPAPKTGRAEMEHADVEAMAFGPDGTVAAAGVDQAHGQQVVKIWDAFTGKEIGVISTEANVAVAFSSDGKTLAAALRPFVPGKPVVTELWSVAPVRVRATLGNKRSVSSLAWSSDGKNLAAGSWDGSIELWTGEVSHPEGYVRFNPDGRMLTASGNE
jgi:WD40 repeat protein